MPQRSFYFGWLGLEYSDIIKLSCITFEKKEMFSGLASYMNNLVGGQSEAATAEKLRESLRIGTMSISYELNDVNFDHLRRKRAFIKGVNLQLSEEYDKEELLGFGGLPDVLPMKPRDQQLANVDYADLMKTILTDEEQK